MYARTSPFADLTPAVTIRAVVLSAPEPGTVVVGAGKRELPHDAGMPTVLSATDACGVIIQEAGGVVAAMFDHHTVLTSATGLGVTDVVEFGVSHPCSAFARWDGFLVTRAGTVVDVWPTEFRTR